MTEETPAATARPKRVSFEIRSESGAIVLTLEDGAELAVHPIVLDVALTAASDERGEPVYAVTGGLAVRLMKHPKEEA